MIWESHYWKEPLLETATWLRRFRIRPGSRETLFVKLEKELLIGFYSVRKLLDTTKVSDATKQLYFEVSWYQNKRTVDFLNWHHLDNLFDLSTEHKERRNIRFICDRFIHSYIFLPEFEEGRISGVYVASDTDRKKKVYFVSLDSIINIFRKVGRDDPYTFEMRADPSTGERVPIGIK